MFQGGAKLSLDAKGRMMVPARYRDALAAQCNGQLTLTKNPAGCLLMYPRPTWLALRERIAALPIDAMEWRRILLGYAADVELDGAGRLLIAPELREAARLERDVQLVSVGTHFEIWDAALRAERESAVDPNQPPPSLAGFAM
ncbi:MAG: division/cell wall cluster transcriptional repressor MraZ [Burkholderiales bacterium]|nr:division/cell wall cluster transcriptional repressor MraZ [Burkholderiales bacterium]